MKNFSIQLFLILLSSNIYSQSLGQSFLPQPGSSGLTSNTQMLQVADSSNTKRAAKFSDPVFPKKGTSTVTLATGIPFLGAIEYNYAINQRMNIGAIYANTSVWEGYGIRFKSVLLKKDAFRVTFKMPIIYYPKAEKDEKEPYVLAWSSLYGEWKLKSGVGIGLGIGLVGVEGADDVFPFLPIKGASEIPAQGYHPDRVPEWTADGDGTPRRGNYKNFEADFWNTISFDITCPLSKRMAFQGSVSLVGKGLKMKDINWFGRVPVIIVLGVTYRL